MTYVVRLDDLQTILTDDNSALVRPAADARGNGERLAVDPNFNQLVLFGSRFNGLLRSMNYGASWSSVGSFPVTTTASTSGANADNVYFHGLSGTESNPIVSFALSQNNFIRYDDLAFIVAKPPAPQNLTATPGDANVSLAWSAAPNATAYYVKRSTTSGSGFATIATNASLTFTNTGLNNGTLYYFTISASNASGEGGNSLEVSARPTSFAPTQLGIAVTGNQLQLNWPADHTGWQLQAQTNTLAVGLNTNWNTIAGSTETNQITLPVNATDAAVFFRLMRL